MNIKETQQRSNNMIKLIGNFILGIILIIFASVCFYIVAPKWSFTLLNKGGSAVMEDVSGIKHNIITGRDYLIWYEVYPGTSNPGRCGKFPFKESK